MVCFKGTDFPVASLQAPLANFVVCTSRDVSCDWVCGLTVALSGLTFLIALYDYYNINKYLKHFTAARRHVAGMLLTLGCYAILNGLQEVYLEERLMWGGLMTFLRIYFVYSYMLHELGLLFIESSFGDYEELIEKTGKVLEAAPHNKSEAWVRSCVLKVHVWMAEVIISFMVKRVCETYLVLFHFEGSRISIWQGAFIYILFVDIIFTIICARGVTQLTALIEPMLAPSARYLTRARHCLFLIFYLLISLVYPSVVSLVFMIVNDGWWSSHSPLIVACHLLPFQWAFHKYYVPRYKWGFGRSELVEIHTAVKSRDDLQPYLKRLAEHGVFFSTLQQDRVEMSKKLREVASFAPDASAASYTEAGYGDGVKTTAI